jgi:hypothetical protein
MSFSAGDDGMLPFIYVITRSREKAVPLFARNKDINGCTDSLTSSDIGAYLI